MSEWDFASTFTAKQVALLIEGKDCSFSTAEGYEHLYQQHASNVILSRMNSDFNDTFFAYACSDDLDGPRKLLPWENKLPSSMMNILAKNCFEFGCKAEFEKWLSDTDKSDFYRQTFERKDIQYWIDVNKFPTKYKFEKKADAKCAMPPVNDEKLAAGCWPWGNHHTELLGHLDAAAQRYWVNYDPSDASTAPLNTTVSEWLQTERKVSRTMADAIASMLRKDGLPTGPRK